MIKRMEAPPNHHEIMPLKEWVACGVWDLQQAVAIEDGRIPYADIEGDIVTRSGAIESYNWYAQEIESGRLTATKNDIDGSYNLAPLNFILHSLKNARCKEDELSGLTRPAISHIESGKRNPSMQNVYRMVTAMKMSMEEFIQKVERHK